MQRLKLKIYGQVQGVFFRDETFKMAKSLGCNGWVKNAEDDSVQVVAEGKEEGLKKLFEWCKIGPRLARVTKVEEEWADIEKQEFGEFRIIY